MAEKCINISLHDAKLLLEHLTGKDTTNRWRLIELLKVKLKESESSIENNK